MKHRIEKPTFERKDSRGTFLEVKSRGPWHAVCTGTIKKGAVMGNHYHKKTSVFFYIIEGLAQFDVVDVRTGQRDRFKVSAGSGVLLRPHQSHAISFRMNSRFLMLKDRPYQRSFPDTFEHIVFE